MKSKILLFCLSTAGSVFAGTPGNSDVSIIYWIAMALLVGMFGIDYLIKYIKKKRLLTEVNPESGNIGKTSEEVDPEDTLQ